LYYHTEQTISLFYVRLQHNFGDSHSRNHLIIHRTTEYWWRLW